MGGFAWRIMISLRCWITASPRQHQEIQKSLLPVPLMLYILRIFPLSFHTGLSKNADWSALKTLRKVSTHIWVMHVQKTNPEVRDHCAREASHIRHLGAAQFFRMRRRRMLYELGGLAHYCCALVPAYTITQKNTTRHSLLRQGTKHPMQHSAHPGQSCRPVCHSSGAGGGLSMTWLCGCADISRTGFALIVENRNRCCRYLRYKDVRQGIPNSKFEG